MTTTKYELKSDKYPKESIYLEYKDGFLSGVLLPIKHRLNPVSFAKLMQCLPYEESGLVSLAAINLKVIKDLPVNEKMAMFCEKYMEYHNGVKYQASGKDALQLKNYNISNEILDHYFKSENFLFKNKHSVWNIARYWNELVADFKNKGTKSHPNHYNFSYANGLSPQELPGYWKHLRDLGLEAKYDRTGNLQEWVKKVK